MNQELEKIYASVEKKISFRPEAALILGSGLGNFAEKVQIVETLDYKDIEGFPVSTVPGHKGRFLFGYVEDVPMVIMQGRVHYYEGYSMKEVTLPIRLMKLMGAKVLFLTNASGGINTEYHAGDFMLMEDHISSFIPSPLIGPNDEDMGPRFPDMSDVYKKEIREIIRRVAKEEDIPLQEGVYVQFTGPAYETPAEIRMARLLGADCRDEHGLRGHRGQPYGHGSLRDFLHHQHGKRDPAAAVEPYGGTGDGRPGGAVI